MEKKAVVASYKDKKKQYYFNIMILIFWQFQLFVYAHNWRHSMYLIWLMIVLQIAIV